jgi:hypothetical protein
MSTEIPGGSVTIDTSNGRIAASYKYTGTLYPPYTEEGSVSWGPPPASAAPGETWTSTLSAQGTCSDASDPLGGGGLTVEATWTEGGRVTSKSSSVETSCQEGSASADLSWAFPAHDGDNLTILAYGGEAHGEDLWTYTYTWQP